MKVFILTFIAMAAFAANSIFCRVALAGNHIDAASFTSIRLISGAILLWGLLEYKAIGSRLSGVKCVVAHKQKKSDLTQDRWLSGLALFTYASAFSFAYIALPTAIGALILFGVVQIVMITYGYFQGESFTLRQKSGFALAIIGLLILFLPQLIRTKVDDIDLMSAFLMCIAGVAWALYSIKAKGVKNAIRVTAYNFLYALPFTCILLIIFHTQLSWDYKGVVYALLSGVLASGAGYALWYTVLPFLKSTYAATVQLTVPVLAAFAGVIWLSEPLTWVISLSSVILLSGVALVINSSSQK